MKNGMRVAALILAIGVSLLAAPAPAAPAEKGSPSPPLHMEPEELPPLPDPLEPLNRAFFVFNDKLYFWVLKPVARGYSELVPRPLRLCVRNFFSNLGMPIRAVNCAIQGKPRSAGREVLRFAVNSTMGIVGLADAAAEVFQIHGKEEDLGQTFGVFGLDPVLYLHWPVFGASSIRDTLGAFGDSLLNPVNYLEPSKYAAAGKGFQTINGVSLRLGEYESMKRSALDPYEAVKNAYHQYRENQIKE